MVMLFRPEQPSNADAPMSVTLLGMVTLVKPVQYRYAAENGLEVTGLHREVYIDGIWNKPDPEDWLTEIQLPVK